MKLGTRRISALGVSFAFHVLAAIAVTSLTPPVRTPLRLERSTLRAASAPGPVADARRHAPERVAVRPDDPSIRIEEGTSNFSLPGFSFDFAKIARRSVQLFPFLTGNPSFDDLLAPAPEDGGLGWASVFRKLRGEAAKPPLVLSDSALQLLLDKAWSRRNRWLGFQVIAALTDLYSPDDGDLPRLLRGYGVQNGLQPYADSEIRDPRLWAQLGLAADHVDFIEFISEYASQHPSSKTTTELLFLLDKLAQASVDALVTLVGTVPAADLQWTLEANRGAYNAIVTIRDYYRIQLERRKLTSTNALRAYYDETRLAILESILRTAPAGYRSSDAKFLIGAIHWRQGKTEEAVRFWNGMIVDPGDTYVVPSSQILTVLRSGDGRPVDARQITRILDGENGRWLMFSIDRLRQFGYHVDTF